MALQEEFEKQGNWLFRYRGILPLFVLLIGMAIYIWTEIYPENFFLEDTPYEIYYNMGCLFVSLLGLAVRIYTVGHTPRNTSGRNTSGQVAESLNTTGLYSIVRHPLYLGNFLMWLGPALVTGNFWFIIAFCLFFWLYYERIMFAEERFLQRKFGEEYTRWAEGTPAFFPAFSKFKKPSLGFSCKKVFKKEKNGLAAIFLIFAIFNITGELVEGQNHFNYVVISLCILSLLLYGVLKYLKTKTTWLNETGR